MDPQNQLNMMLLLSMQAQAAAAQSSQPSQAQLGSLSYMRPPTTQMLPPAAPAPSSQLSPHLIQQQLAAYQSLLALQMSMLSGGVSPMTSFSPLPMPSQQLPKPAAFKPEPFSIASLTASVTAPAYTAPPPAASSHPATVASLQLPIGIARPAPRSQYDHEPALKQPKMDIKCEVEEECEERPLLIAEEEPSPEKKPLAYLPYPQTAAFPTPDATPSPGTADDLSPSESEAAKKYACFDELIQSHFLDAAPRPSSSHSSKSQEDEECFVDVVEDDRVGGKGRRRAHIEYYRKMKGLRGREKTLRCALCSVDVVNTEQTVNDHVNHHTGEAAYRCQICGATGANKKTIFEHMTERHPHRATAFEDRRDMLRLCELIGECFPKVQQRVRTGYHNIVDKIVRHAESSTLTHLKCALCDKQVVAKKASLNKHAQSHPVYRCKTCKFTCEKLVEQLDHCKTEHQIDDARPTVHFNQCCASDVMTRSVQRCFPIPE